MKQLNLSDFYNKNKKYSPFKKLEYKIKKDTNYYACKFLIDLVFRSKIKKVTLSNNMEGLIVEDNYRSLQVQLMHFLTNYKKSLDLAFLLMKHNNLILKTFHTQEAYTLKIDYEDPLGNIESGYSIYMYEKIDFFLKKISNPHSIMSIQFKNRLEDFTMAGQIDYLINKENYTAGKNFISFNYNICDVQEIPKHFSGLSLEYIFKNQKFISGFKDFVRT
jgi:hypothetical protein